MAPHSSTLAWKIPWTQESGRLQSMGSLRVGHDWVTSLSLFTFMHWRRKWQPLQCSCLENPRDQGARWAAVYGVTQSRTRLKRLSSSSIIWASRFSTSYLSFFFFFPDQCFHFFQQLCLVSYVCPKLLREFTFILVYDSRESLKKRKNVFSSF